MSLQQYKQYPTLSQVRLVATSNQSGTYSNGTLNNGVGSIFTYATGALTIDSVLVNVGDRILFSNQTSSNQNGIYICKVAGETGISAILQRADDMQCIAQIKSGMYVSVGAGTVNKGSMFTIVEPIPAAFGIDGLSFSNVSGGGGGSGFLEAANNLSDVSSTTTSVTNLGFSYAAGTYLSSLSTPPGPRHLLRVTQAGGVYKMEDCGYSITNIAPQDNVNAINEAIPLSHNADSVNPLVSFDDRLTRYSDGIMTLAQFNALYTTPIQIIPAPGVDKMIIVKFFCIEFEYGSASPTGGGALYLQYGNTPHDTSYATPVTAIPAAFFTGLGASKVISTPGTMNTTNGLSIGGTSNVGVYMTNATAVFASGTGGSLNWYVDYCIVDAT